MLLNLGEVMVLEVETKFRGTLFKIKVYPRLVHCIKATSGKGMLYDPTTLAVCRKRETSSSNRLDRLENFSNFT